jgi:translation initiation factor 1 (eIF-1/SUI1)
LVSPFQRCSVINLSIIGINRIKKTDIELKKAAKLFANKFATGGSVTKNAQG